MITGVNMLDDHVRIFEAERDRLWGVAYRITGVAADADEMVQDTWLRWQRAGTESADAPIANPAGWLTTVVGRLALDRLRSAQRRRERYVGPWLPEPVDVDPLHGVGVVDPESASLLAESLSLGFMAVLERLGPVERVVFLLHDVFDLPFTEIAGIVDRTPAATRQIGVRARRRVRAERPRFAPEPADLDTLTARFLEAAYSGDPTDLHALLADDVVLVADAGAERRAARAPIVGPHRVGRYLVGLAKRFQPGGVDEGVEQQFAAIRVNGQPALVISVDGELDTVITVTWVDDVVTSIQMVRNRDKLAAVVLPAQSADQS